MQPSLDTEAGFRAFVNEYIFPMLAEFMTKYGEIRPAAHILTKIDPKTKEQLKTPGVVTVLCEDMSTEKAKDHWVSSLKNAAMQLSACGVVVVNEAWMVTAKTSADVSKVRPSDSPDRTEVVMAVIEHTTFGQEIWMADIIREDSEGAISPRLSEFKKTSSSKGKFEGRFTGFLPNFNRAVN